MRHVVVFCLLLLAAACGSSPDPSKAFERTVDGLCPSSPQQLTGTTAVGGGCQTATECKPTCCSCSNGSLKNWLAVSCREGTCATAGVACADTRNDPVLCN